MVDQPEDMFDFIWNVLESRFLSEESPIKSWVDLQNPKLCVITGSNASGKSLIRKILTSHLKRAGIELIHLSIEKRCGHGIEKALIYGNEDEDSTGFNSANLIIKAFNTGNGRTNPFFLLFDEPEIGCGEELQLLIGERIADQYDKMPNCLGIFVMTHSRVITKELLKHNPSHWNMSEEAGLEKWTNRKLQKPNYTLEDLIDTGHERWRQIESLIKRKP